MVLLTMVLLAVVSRPHRYHGNADIASKNQEVNQRITEHPSEPLRIFAAYQKKKPKILEQSQKIVQNSKLLD